jgi:dienelactone hydrolase
MGRNGFSLVDKWEDLASREGIILAGPDARGTAVWKIPEDGPEFLFDLAEELKAKYPINPRRVFLFGHSDGACFALAMSMLESKYFAATAIHAGALQQFSLINYAQRKIPIAIVVGDRDQCFSIPTVTATTDQLKQKGFPVEMTIMPGHDHWYYDIAPTINELLWNCLKRYELTEEPQYERYSFKKRVQNRIHHAVRLL